MLNKKWQQQLVNEAIKASKNFYAPYSKYQVGAALLAVGGEIITSCNSENASLGLTDCADSSAVTKAVSEGVFKKHGRKFIKAFAVVTADGGMPCGRCRQRIREHCDDCLIISANLQGKILKTTTLKKLLPDSFGPDSLGVK